MRSLVLSLAATLVVALSAQPSRSQTKGDLDILIQKVQRKQLKNYEPIISEDSSYAFRITEKKVQYVFMLFTHKDDKLLVVYISHPGNQRNQAAFTDANLDGTVDKGSQDDGKKSFVEKGFLESHKPEGESYRAYWQQKYKTVMDMLKQHYK